MQLTISLQPDAMVKLEDLAISERRRVRDQAAIIIEKVLNQNQQIKEAMLT
jgi:hypothetical protein